MKLSSQCIFQLKLEETIGKKFSAQSLWNKNGIHDRAGFILHKRSCYIYHGFYWIKRAVCCIQMFVTVRGRTKISDVAWGLVHLILFLDCKPIENPKIYSKKKISCHINMSVTVCRVNWDVRSLLYFFRYITQHSLIIVFHKKEITLSDFWVKYRIHLLFLR